MTTAARCWPRGDAYYFAPGHDGWVVGDEPVIGYEFSDSGKDFGPWKTAG